MPQFSQAKAQQFAATGLWREWTNRERALFQLSQRFLCMPRGVFLRSLSAVIDRPVRLQDLNTPAKRRQALDYVTGLDNPEPDQPDETVGVEWET